ncbi:MAG: sigma-70 family RNA polymerase sigma factor [Candidatus Bipolaricaulia bacterium]
MSTAKIKAEATEDLLRKRSKGADPKLEQIIIERHIGLVKSIAKQFLISGEDYDDLIQAGYIGLLNAIHNFDPDRGVKFITYATHLITGEIRHHIRDRHQLIKIPRCLQRLNKRIAEAQERLFKENGRLPSLDELSDELNVAREGIIEALKTRKSMYYISIDQGCREDDPKPSVDISKIRSNRRESDQLPIEDRIGIALIVEKQLSDIQQRVIEGLFYEGKTQKEVGEEIGYSQWYVSKLKTKIVNEIRRLLQDGTPRNGRA